MFVTPYISNPPSDKISTNNEHVVAAITGKKPSLEGKDTEIRELKKEVAEIRKERDALKREVAALKAGKGGKKKKR